MDEDFLTREFEAVLQDEPPLGFDPDDVVASAARRQRRRRMTLLAGGGVVAVAVAAICVPLAVTGGGATERIATAAPTRSAARMWPASVPAQPALSTGTLSKLATAGQQHFGYAVTKAFPDVATIKDLRSNPTTFVTSVDGTTGTDFRQQGYSVTGTVAAGQQLVDLQLDVKVPPAVSEPASLIQRCDSDQHTTCTYDHASDGEVVVTDHEVFPLSAADAAKQLRPGEVLLVKDFRPDGTEVDVSSSVTIAAEPLQVLATPGQLTALARDTAFGPTG
jgi:hypothetical protein